MKFLLETNLTPTETLVRYQLEKDLLGKVPIFKENMKLFLEHKIVFPNVNRSIIEHKLYKIKEGFKFNTEPCDEVIADFLGLFRNRTHLDQDILDIHMKEHYQDTRGEVYDLTAMSTDELCYFWLSSLDRFLGQPDDVDIVRVFFGGLETIFSFYVNNYSMSFLNLRDEEVTFIKEAHSNEKSYVLNFKSKHRKIFNYLNISFDELFQRMESFFSMVRSLPNVNRLLNGEYKDSVFPSVYIYPETRDSFDQTFFTIESTRRSKTKPSIRSLKKKFSSGFPTQKDEKNFIKYFISDPYFNYKMEPITAYGVFEEKIFHFNKADSEGKAIHNIFRDRRNNIDSLTGLVISGYIENKIESTVEEDGRCIRL